MTDLTRFQELWADLDPLLANYKEEVKSLRASVESPEDNATLTDHHDRLKAARRAQDRVEAILADVGTIRARIRKMVNQLQEAYDDAWSASMQRTRTGEYNSAKAQDAQYALGALQEQVNLRRAKRFLEDVEEIYDYINLKYRGLSDVRSDAKASLRVIETGGQYDR